MIFWFTRLYAAHLLADFVFQSGLVYQLKIRGPLGSLVHIAIVVAITGAVLWPFAAFTTFASLGVALLALGLTHFGLDWLKEVLRASGHYAGLIGFLGDQLSHATVLLALSAWLLPPVSPMGTTQANWEDLLLNNLYWWILSGSILVTYLVGFTLYYLEGQPTNEGSPVIGRYSGFLERLAIFGLVALGPLLSFVLLPLPMLLRGLYLTRIRREPLPSIKSLVLGPLLAALIGGLIRLLPISG